MARILVAEDEEAVREFVRRALSHHGHEVTAVDDGTRALEALSAGHYDLLLTDIVMPGMDGIALALKVSKDHPELPILLMSGYPGQRERAHNLDALIHRVISKPFSLREICDAAEATLAGAAAGAADQASS
ncbi:MAG: response regulator [Proteobacteria bacterium]|nr:response regulator [Pseudomonadota bacterium]